MVFALSASLVLRLPAGGAGRSAPSAETDATQVALSGVAGGIPYGGGWAVPLRCETPSWYTAQLATQVHVAPGVPVASPTDAPLPGEVGIRPGSWMISPAGCTMNFVFQSGPESVWHYGHRLGIGTGGTPRAGVALTWQANAFGWDGAAIFGDSGSAVRVGTGLAAAGDLMHLVVDTTWLPSFIAGTRSSKIQQIAGGWTLASSPLCV